MCGEKNYTFVFSGKTSGITPACAGKSTVSRRKTRSPWDHPRVCGEKCSHRSPARKLQGSPPRVRGKDPLHAQFRRAVGITPACAGKRRKDLAGKARYGDHPRVCGEKFSAMTSSSTSSGSPPRVRGKDFHGALARPWRGITPACAGKRLKKALKNKDF